jgi:hypothetical protein
VLVRNRSDGWKRNSLGLVMLVLSACFLFGVMEAQQGGKVERERIGQRQRRGRFPELMGRFGQRFPSDPPFFPPNSRQRLSGRGFRSRQSRQQSQNVELIGFTGGVIYDVFVKNNYAYCASGSGLLIFDVSNPSNPQLVGKLLMPDSAVGIYVSGNYAYVADYDAGLRVIDVSNPTNPREVGFFDTPGYAWDVYVSGNYAYVADGWAGLRVIDVSNPSNPREIGFFDTPGDTIGVYVSGNYAYVASGWEGLRVIDVSNPSNPREVGHFVTSSDAYAQDVYVSGNYAYVANMYEGLRVIDISNPSNPREVGYFLDNLGNTIGVYVSGNYAYVVDRGTGLRVIDVSNPSNLREVGYFVTPGYAQGVYVSGNYAYVASGWAGLRVIDVSNPTNPREVGFFDTPGYAWDVYVSGNYAYVADGGAGLRVIDVSNPSNPREVGFFYTPGFAFGVYVSGNYAYVADGGAGLRVIDVSNPANPREIGFFDTPGFAEDVYVSGNYAYVADGDAGLRVIDVSNPTNPREVGFFYTPGFAFGVYVSGNYAYVADGVAGLRVIDVSNPANPREVGFFDTPDFAQGVYVSGNYAYVADEYEGLKVIDVSNPSNPREVGFFDTPGYAWDVYVSGNYAYVADGWAGLRVIDVSNPANPREVGFFYTPGFAQGVYVSGNYAYVANGFAGLFILRFTGAQPVNHPPSIPVLLSPANNATVSPTPTFKVKSEDPDGDQVKFEIEVVKGSETKRFETGFFASGSEATFTVPENQSLSSGQWSWRARAIDSKGAASGWSETRTFIVNRPPLTPVLLSPEDKAFVLSTLTLKVKAEDPEGERVKFILELTQGETMKNFETVSINSGEELTFTVPEKLSAGKWQWRAKAIDTKGAESEWSELRTFVVSTVPSKPVLVSPEEDTIVPTSPTFQLKAEDIDEGQPLKFKIVVVEDISPPSPPRQQGEAKIWVFDQTQNPAGWDKGSYTSGEIATFTVPSDKPLPIGRYRWWAFAFDGLEWSERSEQRRIIVVSEQPPSNISAAVDGYLLDLIDKHANSFYNPKWDITLNQYKAWIAAIAWGAGGKGGYSAHSQTNPSYRGDLFYHVNAGTSFTFSTGLGYFQLDREGGEEGWDRWPSIDKLNPEKSLISVLRWHYGNFRAGATLKDFVGFSLWSSIQSEQIAGIWQQVTGTNWDDHKDKKRWLDWQLVRKSLSQNAANQSFRYENNIINIGKVQWIISEGDDIKTDTGKLVIFNGQYETWLIKARSWQGDTLFEYYYTYDPQAQVEVWAWKNNPKYIFTREYGSFIEGQFPDGRIPGTNEAGFTLNHDALIFAGERLALQSGPQYSSGDGNLRYFISASPGAGGGQSRQAGTEVLIINPIDTNLDEKTVQFEGVSHPSSLVEQIVDVQKREIRWRFRLSNTGNELVWVQFSIAPKPNLPSGTLIRSKASVIINEQKFETNELITIIDKKAPQINFQALSPIQSKPKFDVQWTVSDDASGVDRVEIWVSDDGSELFLWRVFTAEESKATYIGRFGHEYFFYVVAVDKAGNRSEFPEVAHGWTKVGQPPKIPAGLRIVTLPIISEYSDPKDVFGFEGDKWVWYDPKTGKYVRYPEPPAYILSVGKAFWGQFSQDTFPKAKGEVINDASPFAVTLQKGWNLVGNPWLSDLVWDISSLRVRIGGQEKSLRELKENEGVEPYAWKWDGSNYRLVFDRTIIAGVDNVLPSWEGAWVYAHTDCELILPPPSRNKGRGTRGEGRVAKGNGWSMRLQASVNGSVGEAVLGIANGTRGLAVGLPPEPPTGNNGVQVILLKNNTPLAVDVRNDGSRRQEWEVLVRWDKGQVTRGMGERKEVVLTFDGIGYAPKDVSAWLVDIVTGKRLYLRTQPSYRFVAQEGEVERKFKVVVERGNDRPLRVVGLKATPMRGQGVVIEFSLTKPAKVEAEVLTLTGRRVAVLDAGSSEGLARRIVWRGVGIEGQKVGSGVYLVRVRAVDEEGREVQAAIAVRLR